MDDTMKALDDASISADDLSQVINRYPALILDDAIKLKMEKSEKTHRMDLDESTGADDLLAQIDLANKFVAEIDDRIKTIFKAVKNSYTKRFPELKVPDPMQYILTVQLLGNKPDRIKDDAVKQELNEFLEPKMQLLITMSASTTQGIKLEPDEIKAILRACALATQLSLLRIKLLAFVENHMHTIAPNLSTIVGAPIAAKLMGLAGGLDQLANMPSCNVPALGAHRVSNIEADINAPPRVGLIYDCDLIQQIPFDHSKDIRKRAVRLVANKCVLAARCDVAKSDAVGSAGKMFRDKIETQINKELEPPPKKAARPLPAPIDKSGKKRGGKRVRRMKERYAQTELRKAANRINFGDVGDDAYQNDLGFGRSQLNAIQKLRGPQINEKSKISLSKAAQKKLAQARAQVAKQAAQPKQNSEEVDQKKNVDITVAPAPNDGGITLTAQQNSLEIFNPKAKDTSAAGTSGQSGTDYFSSTVGFFNLMKSN